jgi:hypothetical protein
MEASGSLKWIEFPFLAEDLSPSEELLPYEELSPEELCTV